MYAAPLDFVGPIVGKRLLLCGLGEEAVALAKAGADVYGFDVSDAQVQAVNDLARQLGLRNQTHFQALTDELLPYPDAFFDLAFVRHSEFKARGKELARVLKRDGQAALMVYSRTW
jgi:SAM-dependent methyltransferase